MYRQLPPSFAVSIGVQQECPIYPFMFNFAVDDLLRGVSSRTANCRVDFLPSIRVPELDYVDNVTLPGVEP